MPRFRLILWIAAGFLFILLPVSMSIAQSAGPAPILEDHAGGAANGVEVTLAADRAPEPGEIVTLSVTARPLQPAADLQILWELPDGGQLLGGGTEDSLGAVAAGESVTLTRQVRFDGPGVYEVRARAAYFPNRATSLAASGVLFFTVRQGASSASDLDPQTPSFAPPPARTTVDKSALTESANSVNQTAGCFNVHGTLTRENNMPVAVPVPIPGDGPGAPPFYRGEYRDQRGSAVPVHHMLVELREDDTVSDDSYGHTVTDANGNFSFGFCDDDGVLDDELELYFRVCAEVWNGPDKIARVEQTDSRNLYCWDSGILESEGGDVNFDVTVYRLKDLQARVFNIADALYYGWKYWNNNAGASPRMDRPVIAYWQAGKGQKGSFYSSGRGMFIADDPSERAEWADSVIIHEWGHFADDMFSCDQNPGGRHALPGRNTGMNGNRLAWGEGYPDYYQSAARQIMPGSESVSFYVNPDGPTVDLENMRGVSADDLDEGAVAGLLWDLMDTVNDNSDTVSHGHAAIQQVYTAPDFQGNAQCDLRRFLQVWRKLKQPTDAATAATIVQNANITLASLPPIALAAQAGAEDSDAPSSATAAPPLDYRWWDQATMVIDASSSMAGPAAAPKINTVKTIVNEQVRDLAARPSGTEFNIYTFDAAAQVKPLQEGAFFANKITPAVNGLAANGADAGCPVPGLDALAQAAQGKFDGQAWLYTDGDSADSLYPEQMRAQFNEQQLRGSVVLLGGCGAPAREQKDVTGGERTYLSLAADGSQSSGIVPYLLTAVGTGGQFLYVAPDQLANAVDMVRAQLGHSAGAGRWSDYVSNIYTYRWDRLQPWEYEWVQVEAFGRDAGQLSTGSLLPIDLPAPFSFYDSPDSKVFVSEDGYLRVGQPCASLFCVAWEFRRVNALAGNLNWRYNAPGPRQDPSAADGAAEDGLQVHAYTTPYNNDWFIVSTQGTADSGAYRAFQTWLNLKTGEIRLQYDYVQNEAATAEIGLQHSLIFPQADVVVSKNRAGGAANGIGYKFTPAPPQPSKTYEVEVDPLIESVIFLQTGYSGDFAPLLVTWPDGTAVTCSESGVRCLTADNKPGDHMVQYVQVNTSGRSGLYKATVAVGPLGGGTYSFNALAASELRAVSPDRHTLPLSGHTLRVDLGRPTDDGTLQAWLQTPDGDSFGAPFTMYDDGNHADGAAGDGRFGSGPFTPPNAGAAYLWVYGATGGVDFRRSDPAPFNFQPLDVQAKTPYKEGYYGENVTVPFRVTNQDAVSHCYSAAFTVPEGWTYSAPEYQFCVPGRATAQPYVWVGRTLGPQTTGEKGVVTMTLTEVEAGQITGSAAAQVALFRPPVALEFDNRWVDVPLRPNGTDTADMTVNVIDDLGQIVGISGPAGDLQLSATLGTAVSPTGRLDNGRLPILYTAGNSPGVAEITLLSEGPPLKTTITLAAPAADTLAFSASPTNLADAPSAALLATVRDVQGNPVAGQTVRFSVSDDDGDKGTIAGGELWEGSTNSQGEVTATFVKADGASGAVVVRAELLSRQGEVLREESLTLRLSQGAGENGLYLPFIGR